jgi:hypothetical protein
MGEKAPSWPVVLVTTMRLWLERHKLAKGNRRRTLLGLAVLVAAGLAVTLAVVLLVQPGSNRATADQGKSTGAAKTQSGAAQAPGAATLQAATLARDQAAGWIAQQVSSAAIVSCDPATCLVLQARGVPAAQLLVLLLASADPLGSDVIVATPALRSQFGDRLVTVYAPEMLASFGSGDTRVDVRAIAPDGAQAYQAAVVADRAERIAAGGQLLRNNQVSVPAAARAALTSGDVDPRLLVMLAAAAQLKERLTLVAFGDPSPGAPDVPLRSAEISVAQPANLVSFLRAQRTPYLPAHTQVIQLAGGQNAVNIEYGAPGPLGLGGK